MAERFKKVTKYLCKVVLESKRINGLIISKLNNAALHNLLLYISCLKRRNNYSKWAVVSQMILMHKLPTLQLP